MKKLITFCYVILGLSAAILYDFIFQFIYYGTSDNYILFGAHKATIFILVIPIRAYLAYKIWNYFINKIESIWN